jgi:hypothetical protein
MSAQTPHTCATCPAFVAHAKLKAVGECRANPPKVHKAGDRGYWPIIPSDDYCMRHPEYNRADGETQLWFG